MELKKLKCTECGAILEIKEDLDFVYCSYCGTKNYIDDEASNIVRTEKAKLDARKNNHEQDMKEQEDKIILWKKRLGIYKTEEEKKELERQNKRIVIIVWSVLGGLAVIGIICGILFGEKDPTLDNFSKLELGMSYNQCVEILGKNGHLTSEEENKIIYTWYESSCLSDEKDDKGNCPVIIELKFEDNKLTERHENGLK